MEQIERDSNDKVGKRRTREWEEDDKVISGRRGKIDSTRDENSETGNKQERHEKKDSQTKFKSCVYDHLAKNDVMNVIWKLTAPKEEFLMGNASLSFSEHYVSKRNDSWSFDLIYANYGKNSGGSFKFRIKTESSVKPKGSGEKSFLDEVFTTLNFEIDTSFQLLNYKTTNFTLKNLAYNNWEEKEINIPNDFYTGPNFYSSTRSNQKDKYNEDDEVIIIIEMSIFKHFPSLVKESKCLGFTGIINEAATCYMNSMLQTLNIFGAFKKAVFQIPTTDEDYNSVALSLQRLFYDLMTDINPVSTNRLVRSFGWGREQMLIQHDIQEFNILLSDVMEKKMKGTPGEGTFNRLFAGTINNLIQCINVDYKSVKEEKFTDLQLSVKGFKDIYDSLNSYTEEEILDNADKYDAGTFGKQKAKKSIKFVRFPSILIIQLKRFEYNPKKDLMTKINDYFEFNEELDLCKYLINPNSEKKNDNKYTLHSVVVHQGSANSGHYYAYIRPTLKDYWIQFNDEIVRPADKYEVFKNNFGGSYKTYKHRDKGEIISNTNYFESNAYILVYIKNTDRPQILSPISSLDISPIIKERFERDKNDEKKAQSKKVRMTENMNICLVTKENIMSSFVSRPGIITPFVDLGDEIPLIYNKESRLLINFPRNLTFNDLLNYIKLQTNIPICKMHLYEYENGSTGADLIKARAEYDLILIDSNRLNRTLFEATNNLKKRIVCFFLYVSDDKYTVISKNLNKNSPEDFSYMERLVHIDRNINLYSFHSNPLNYGILESEYEVDPNNKIYFIKELDPTRNKFLITKIISTNVSNVPSFEEFKECIENEMIFKAKDAKYNLLIEKCSLNEMAITQCILTKTNFSSILNRLSSMIIIPITQNDESLLYKIDDLYNTIFIDIFCQNKNINIINKLELHIKACFDDNQIKHIILTEIKNQNLLSLIFPVKNHYLIDMNKITEVSAELLNNILSIDNIELISERESSPKFSMACKEIPLLRYVNQADCRIDINVNLCNKQNLVDSYFQEISLFDQHNNRLCLLSVIIPKKIKKCRDVIEYLYDSIISMQHLYNCVDDNSIPTVDEFFFYIQNREKGYVYQFMSESNIDLLKYEGRADSVEYRLQPLPEEEIELIKEENMKLFVAFNTNFKKCIDPIVIFVPKNKKLIEIKFLISEKIKQLKHSVNFTDYYLKFNTCKIDSSGNFKKDQNLLQVKDEESAENIFKDPRVNNILVEICK